MCLFCGDPFGPERLLVPLVGTKSCVQTGERSVLMDQEIRSKTRRLEIILSSYHSATDFRHTLHTTHTCSSLIILTSSSEYLIIV